MHLYKYIHACIYTHVNTHTESRTLALEAGHYLEKLDAVDHTYMHTYIHTYIHTQSRTLALEAGHNLENSDAVDHTNIHTYIYTYIHTYIHTYVHIYTHRVALSRSRQATIWRNWMPWMGLPGEYWREN